MYKHYLSDPEKIVIRKKGQQIFMLSRYSDDKNAAIRFIEGNENGYFLPPEAPLEDIYHGKYFAECWDSQAPAGMGNHGILGANHGSPFAFRIHLLRHWLFESDIGKVMVDDAGNKFVLVSIENLSDFTLHSDIPEPGEKFCPELIGNLHIEGKTIIPEKTERGMLTSQPGGQLSPHRRYNSVRLFADGKRELADDETVECSFAELHWDVDLILPEALLDYLKKHPGKYVSPTDPRLPGAVHSKTIVTFRSCCTRTVDTEITFLQDFPESLRYGMLQFFNEVIFSEHERLLPGVKPIETGGLKIDLSNPYRFPDDFPVSYFYTKADCTDPAKLPCRYIDFFGNNGIRELGVVLGYSMTQGITARGREAERGNSVQHLYSSTKIYPFAYEKNGAGAGEQFRLYAYQQFFQPDPSGVSCYHHQEQDGYFIYADFPHRTDHFPVKLPAGLIGKTIEIQERDPEISVQGKHIPENGTVVLQASAPGGIVLRIR